MKFLLAAVNAKYIHSNLGVYSLKKYADEKRKQQGTAFSGPDWNIPLTTRWIIFCRAFMRRLPTRWDFPAISGIFSMCRS